MAIIIPFKIISTAAALTDIPRNYAQATVTLKKLQAKYDNNLLSSYLEKFGHEVYKVLHNQPIDQEKLKKVILRPETRLLFLLLQEDITSELEQLALWQHIIAISADIQILEIAQDPSVPLFRSLLPAFAKSITRQLQHLQAEEDQTCWEQFTEICSEIERKYTLEYKSILYQPFADNYGAKIKALAIKHQDQIEPLITSTPDLEQLKIVLTNPEARVLLLLQLPSDILSDWSQFACWREWLNAADDFGFKKPTQGDYLIPMLPFLAEITKLDRPHYKFYDFKYNDTYKKIFSHYQHMFFRYMVEYLKQIQDSTSQLARANLIHPKHICSVFRDMATLDCFAAEQQLIIEESIRCCQSYSEENKFNQAAEPTYSYADKPTTAWRSPAKILT